MRRVTADARRELKAELGDAARRLRKHSAPVGLTTYQHAELEACVKRPLPFLAQDAAVFLLFPFRLHLGAKGHLVAVIERLDGKGGEGMSVRKFVHAAVH